MATATVIAQPACVVDRTPPWVRGVGLFLLVRAVGVAVLAVMSAAAGDDLLDRLTAWDGQWYLALAEHGYQAHGATTVDADGQPYAAAPYAFFPLYPMAMSIVAALGIPLPVAGLVVSTLAGAAAVPALLRLAQHVDPRPRVGQLLVVLWAGAPMAGVLSMVYTEAAATALAAWALVGVLERRWVLAGVCTLLAGLTRSSAVVLIAVVVAAALLAVWRDRAGWRPVAAVALAPLGLLGFWAWVVASTGQTWQQIEARGWRVAWDYGAEALDWITRTLFTERHVMETFGVAVVLGAVLLAVLLVRRVPWPLAAYGVGIVVLTLGSSGIPFAKPRFLLVGAIILLIPVATGLAGRRTSATLAVASVWVLGGAWFSAYSLTVWGHAI
ncbi:hypothetical protein [Prauserella flavalba]|uniref:hypothetical protein n=1 Tax=Prauserella flavalba TaxID=1477506 RepID=UPI0036EFC271